MYNRAWLLWYDIGSAKGEITRRDNDESLLPKMFEMMKELKADVNVVKLEIQQIKHAVQAYPSPGMVTTTKEARQWVKWCWI